MLTIKFIAWLIVAHLGTFLLRLSPYSDKLNDKLFSLNLMLRDSRFPDDYYNKIHKYIVKNKE